MNFLVTGAAGFIGSNVVSQLLERGDMVVGIDNLNDYYDVRLKQWRLEQLLGCKVAPLSPRAEERRKDGRFHFVHLDVENLAALQALFLRFRFDAVFNLAARAGVRYSMENPHVYLTTNAHGTLNILECMRAHGVKKHVLASTSSLYAGCAMPFSEAAAVNEPLSPYAASKKAAEMLAYSYHRLHGIDSSVLRYFTVYGPAGRPDMSVFRFIKWIDEQVPLQLFGDGTQARDFTYVDDIARGTILAAQSVGYEVINLGGGRNPISLRALIGEIEAALGKRAIIEGQPFHAADVKETWADIGKAGSLLGWSPEIGLREGIRRCVAWHHAQRGLVASIQV